MSNAASISDLSAKLDAMLERLAAPPQRFFTVGGSASYSGLSVESIRKLLAAGKLTALRPVKGRILIDRLPAACWCSPRRQAPLSVEV